MKKCVFFDRDGIVNRSPGPGYVESLEQFELIPEFVDVLRLVTDRGYAAVVVTNQRGIAVGRMSAATVDEIHDALRARLRDEHGLVLLDILMCPHDRDTCDCRKPKPGMLLEAARRHDIDLSVSWMIGDQERDVEAGRRAGCRTILVAEGAGDTRADHRVPHLAALQTLVATRL